MTEDVALIHHARRLSRLSVEALRLSPMTNTQPSGTVCGSGQIAHMLEYIDRFVDIRLIENLAVDAHVAGYGINVHRIAAGRQ